MISSVQQIHELVEQIRSQKAGEAEKSKRFRQLLEANQFLERQLEAPDASDECKVLHAKIASLMEDWDQAIIRWSRVQKEVTGSRDRAFLNLSIAYRKTSSFARARAALKKIKDGKVSKSAIREEIKKIGKLENEFAGRILGARAVEVIGSDKATPESISLLEGALHMMGWDPARSRIVKRLTMQLLEGDCGVKPSNKLKAPPIVFFAGFGWSGSGAFHDYFKQSPQIATPVGSAEIALFEGHWGAHKVIKTVSTDWSRWKEAMINFILQPVFGVSGPQTGTPTKWERKVLVTHYKTAELCEALADACLELYGRVRDAAAKESKHELEEAFRRFFARVFALRIGRGKVGMMSNCITGAKAHLARLVENSRTFVVFRDPRDQYVAQVYEYSGRQHVSVDGFIQKVAKRMARFEKIVASGKAPVIEKVQFEHFVQSAEYRREIGAKMGIDVSRIAEGEGAYHPRDSLQNIGIHASYAHQEEIQRIRQELPGLILSES